ncbi:helix-turn-helix domain-containing protein [Paenibacillus silvae]|uniref:spr1629 family repressor/antitoxin n=1 Tax=Paenibacillus TaxID=44249 RepID=UPI001C11F924|nr:XRE family transcriptional regulator [Paenibacillus silvae]MBU5355281.1 XRE family transcriptional regulator [Paenibacillus barcinonensis]MDM5280404.1 XRE family transcriptional regulator [Paenibacillus silvae]
MFMGENLTNLRIMHGYSRKELSEKLGVTEQAVWQYENAYTSPKVPIVNELIRIFSVKSKYFYEKDMLARQNNATNINVMNIAYRSKVMNVISKTQTEAKHVEYLDTFVNYITSQISLPTLKIIELREEAIQYMNHSHENRPTQIQYVAKLARQRLNLEPATNENLMFWIEKSGVYVFEKAIGEGIDAYSLWTRKDRPFIILGNIKRSAVRRNFDIAHELGHLLLHYRQEFVSLDRKEHKEIENEANLFAGAFLLPEEEFAQDIKAIPQLTNPDHYLELKNKWKTSLQVLGYRAANLGLMDAKSHRNFYAAMHRRGYLEREPFDQTIPLQTPMRIRTIIDLLAKKGLVDIRHMIEQDWKVETSFFHHLTGIKTEFFNSYMTNRSTATIRDMKNIPT